eukprot:scaffold118802_cov63-Phaeocystis_antarctica.AAC.2
MDQCTNHTISHTHTPLALPHGTRFVRNRTVSTHTHSHTQYIYIHAVRRECTAPGPRAWFRPSPVAHRLALASLDKPLPILPPSLFFSCVCEVGRDRHAQKAGCGSRAVAIDSAAVTRAQIPIYGNAALVPLVFVGSPLHGGG